MIAAETESPIGPPPRPDYLVRSALERLEEREQKVEPECAFDAFSALEPHFAAIAANVIASKTIAAGKPPKTAPKIPVSVICVRQPLFAQAAKKSLRNFGPFNGVSFVPDFAGVGVAPDGFSGWIKGVDGTLDASASNMRSWKNRLKTADFIAAPSDYYTFVDSFIKIGGAAVFEIVDDKSMRECVRRFSRYTIYNAGNILYLVCAGARMPSAAGSAMYDEIVRAFNTVPRYPVPGYTDD